MNAGPVVDRVYACLRDRLMTHHYRPGERLEVAELRADLVSSNTPVRDALNRLAGEGLVATPAREGFSVRTFDEPGLSDLYGWSDDLMRLALARLHPGHFQSDRDRLFDGPYAARVAALFEAIARWSDNTEHSRAVADCGARLGDARTIEPDLFPDVEDELHEITELFRVQSLSELRSALRRYHARRVRCTSALVRLLYRPHR